NIMFSEKRQNETTYRGVKNPQAVERNKKNKEMEKQEMRPSPSGGGGGLKVIYLNTLLYTLCWQ
uniref:Uncharacterized protein n=1 Tax=Hucho hucho TaxID=62062 RepID=A0A4W5RJ48_9TELE